MGEFPLLQNGRQHEPCFHLGELLPDTDSAAFSGSQLRASSRVMRSANAAVSARVHSASTSLGSVKTVNPTCK